jgi:phosphoserine phosphatase
LECAAKLGVDLAVSFAESSAQVSLNRNSLLTIQADVLKPEDLARISRTIFQSRGNIRSALQVQTSPYSVYQLLVSGSSHQELKTSLSQIELSQSIEYSFLTLELSGARKLVVLDVDSTLIDQEVIELLAARAGVQEQVTKITESAMRGELDFAQSLAARVLLLKGLPASVLVEVQSQLSLTLGANELISTLQELGHVVALVTGGFLEVVSPLAKELNIKYIRANTLEIKDNFLTGMTSGVIVDRAEKAKALIEFAELEAIPLAHTIAIGDGANDLDMLSTSGLGVAFMAKPILRSAADININVRDLARLLTLLGLPRKS